jgi:hypothetical protein
MALSQIPTYICPSDSNSPSATSSLGRVHLWLNTANGFLTITAGSSTPPAPLTGSWGYTNYMGVAGYFGTGYPNFRGIFFDRSTTKITAITDGTSNTLMFGETVGDVGASLNWTWMGAGVLPTGFGIPVDPNKAIWPQFSSFHTGVVQFCFGDGSVRALRAGLTTNPDFSTYVYISGYNDGMATDYSGISP